MCERWLYMVMDLLDLEESEECVDAFKAGGVSGSASMLLLLLLSFHSTCQYSSVHITVSILQVEQGSH